MGMKLKEKLERANSDQDKLSVLRKFKDLSQEMLSSEEFPLYQGENKERHCNGRKTSPRVRRADPSKQDALDG